MEILERATAGVPADAADAAAVMRAWLEGGADDAQMAAMLVLGWTGDALDALVGLVVDVGDRLELGRLGQTGAVVGLGAVADPSELAVAPVAAALGVRVAALVAPAVGPVAGSEDKLGAIPGMRVGLPATDIARAARDTGIVVAAGVERMGAGIRRLRRLADAVGMSGSVPVAEVLLAARALAVGAETIVLDAPTGAAAAIAGDGAETAGHAAAALDARGRAAQVAPRAAAEPLGPVIGTALEIAAVADVLLGRGDEALRERVCELSGRLAELVGVAPTGRGAAMAGEAIDDGRALAAAERWVEGQGGIPEVWTDDALLAQAPLQREVGARRSGRVEGVDARGLADVARWLGAGRMHPQQAVDYGAGVEILVRAGDLVEQGQPVLVLHGREPGMVDASLGRAAGAVRIAGDR